MEEHKNYVINSEKSPIHVRRKLNSRIYSRFQHHESLLLLIEREKARKIHFDNERHLKVKNHFRLA